jgi:hypothetical protein
VSRRKVITEITIETNQVLVIKRRQITRSRCSECGSEAGFAQPDKVSVPVDETGTLQGVEASSGTPHFTRSADGSGTIYLRSLPSATTLAKRFLNRLRRGGKRESDTPGLKG